MAFMTSPLLVFDGHNDLPWAMRKLCGYDMDEVDLTGPVAGLHTDVPRLRKGQVGAQFWSVFVPSKLTGGEAVTATLEQIDFVHRMAARYPDDFALAVTADDVRAAMDAGRIASLLGMEGGHSIDESLGVLRMMRALGVRYMTLTHNDNNPWADSATDEPVLGGLSPFGEEVVAEMNRIGMLVDLSHVSADVMRHALRVTTEPVIFSHSSARAVCENPRNVPDDVLETLASNGGVCMVAFVPMFVSPALADWYEEVLEEVASRGQDPRDFSHIDPVMQERAGSRPVATIADVVRHIEHIREVAGIDHVGIGGDYDGVLFMPEGLPDVSSYPAIFDALTDNGWSAADLEKLANGNIIRVLQAADLRNP
jgi:membrane dipeptidase